MADHKSHDVVVARHRPMGAVSALGAVMKRRLAPQSSKQRLPSVPLVDGRVADRGKWLCQGLAYGMCCSHHRFPSGWRWPQRSFCRAFIPARSRTGRNDPLRGHTPPGTRASGCGRTGDRKWRSRGHMGINSLCPGSILGQATRIASISPSYETRPTRT